MPADQKLKILFLAANPINTTQLRLEQELRDVKIALRQSRYRDQFDLQAVSAARINDMRQAMLEIEPQILHFSGHGEGGAIYLEDNAGNARPIGAAAFANFLANFPSVQCVVLNACYSEDLGAAINTTVPFVVGMETAVEDEAAISFAVAFYDVLGSGGNYERAFRLAANALELEDKLTAANPILVKSPTAGSVPPPVAVGVPGATAAASPQPATPPATSPAASPQTSPQTSPQAPPAASLATPPAVSPATSPATPSATPSATPLSLTRLTGPQFKQLHEALLAAFNQEELTRMVMMDMGVNINSVAGGSNLSAVVFNLIDWAQRTGRLGELVTAAAGSNDENPELKAFVASLHN
jgi:hypothetical protein